MLRLWRPKLPKPGPSVRVRVSVYLALQQASAAGFDLNFDTNTRCIWPDSIRPGACKHNAEAWQCHACHLPASSPGASGQSHLEQPPSHRYLGNLPLHSWPGPAWPLEPAPSFDASLETEKTESQDQREISAASKASKGPKPAHVKAAAFLRDVPSHYHCTSAGLSWSALPIYPDVGASAAAPAPCRPPSARNANSKDRRVVEAVRLFI